MDRKMPSQEEQEAVIWYVLKRPLRRPNTSYQRVALYVASFAAACAASTLLLYALFDRLGIFYAASPWLAELRARNPTGCLLLLGAAVLLLAGAIFGRKAAIGAIHLYQRYAPEAVRRKCLFKPTCSEYAILAIRKYGLIVGLIKSYKRLFRRCKGRIYRIDYP